MEIDNLALLHLLSPKGEIETNLLKGENSDLQLKDEFSALLSEMKFHDDLTGIPKNLGDTLKGKKSEVDLLIKPEQTMGENLVKSDSSISADNISSQGLEQLLSRQGVTKNPMSSEGQVAQVKNSPDLQSILKLGNSKDIDLTEGLKNADKVVSEMNSKIGQSSNDKLQSKLNELRKGLSSFKNLEEVMINQSKDGAQDTQKPQVLNKLALNKYMNNDSSKGLISKLPIANSMQSDQLSSIDSENGFKAENQVSKVVPMMNGSEVFERTESQVSKSESKVLNITKMNGNNIDQIINKITDYVTKTSFESKQSLDLVVRHDSLGDFSINVRKGAHSDDIGMKILTNSAEGHRFFVDNESSLIKALNNAGVKIGDMRIVNSSESSSLLSSFGDSSGESKFEFGQNSQKNSNSSFGSERGQQQHDSQKRKQMWDEMQERLGA